MDVYVGHGKSLFLCIVQYCKVQYYRLVLAQTPLHGALFECCSMFYFLHFFRDFSYMKNVLFLRLKLNPYKIIQNQARRFRFDALRLIF